MKKLWIAVLLVVPCATAQQSTFKETLSAHAMYIMERKSCVDNLESAVSLVLTGPEGSYDKSIDLMVSRKGLQGLENYEKAQLQCRDDFKWEESEKEIWTLMHAAVVKKLVYYRGKQ